MNIRAPYTEKRLHLLDEANRLVGEYMDANADQLWEDMPEADKEAFWKRKADILFLDAPSDQDISLDTFEYGALAVAERLFTVRRGSPAPSPRNTWDTRPTCRVASRQVPRRASGYAGSARTDTTPLHLQASTPFVPMRYGISQRI